MLVLNVCPKYSTWSWKRLHLAMLNVTAASAMAFYADLFNVVVHIIGEDDYIVKLDEARLPLIVREYKIGGSLETDGLACSTERLTRISKRSGMEYKSRISYVFLTYLSLTIRRVVINFREVFYVAECIDELVHSWKGICILHRNGVTFSVIDTKT